MPFESTHCGAAVASTSLLMRDKKALPIAALSLFSDSSKRKLFEVMAGAFHWLLRNFQCTEATPATQSMHHAQSQAA